MKMRVNVCKHVASAKPSTMKWNYRQLNPILAVFVSVCVCLQDTLYSMSLLDWTSGWLPQCHKDMWSLVHRLVKMLLISVFSCSCLQLCIDSKAHWVLVVKCQTTTTAPYQKCFQNFRHRWEARTFRAWGWGIKNEKTETKPLLKWFENSKMLPQSKFVKHTNSFFAHSANSENSETL